ncbi:LANO_0E02894g1_1 [Lachancea nothofagi CBS 11611]|uniref:LANO_0E02894g1_1 n=1 Tax=Lachancea nothofagi CBS 11611 TaxID=1266666 RepID=A0A1G4JQG8_9SACH|nr:LANO_0E02894g1_1 [Lachancea nothofagi CBS 11611]
MTPISFDGLNLSKTSKTFNAACDEIEHASCKNINPGKVKKEIDALFSSLRLVADQLPAYDVEKYNARLEKLLKKVTDEGQATKKRKFQFKGKPKVDTPATNATPGDVELVDPKSKLTRQNIRYDQKIGNYQNLEDSSLSYENENEGLSENIIQSSSLHVRSLLRSVINFNGTPFNHGSIHIENAQDSVILLKLQAHSNIQVRLFGLHNCKVYIVRAGTEPQTIILENCSECQFHSDMKNTTTIQDFSNIGKLIEESEPSFSYVSFST